MFQFLQPVQDDVNLLRRVLLGGDADDKPFAVGEDVIVSPLIQQLIDRNLELNRRAKTYRVAVDDIDSHELVRVVDVVQPLPVRRPNRMVASASGNRVFGACRRIRLNENIDRSTFGNVVGEPMAVWRDAHGPYFGLNWEQLRFFFAERQRPISSSFREEENALIGGPGLQQAALILGQQAFGRGISL